MLIFVLACVVAALVVTCVAIALSEERRRTGERDAFVRRLNQNPEYDAARMLRNRSERSEDW
jgi:hypothetical protein